MKPLGVKNYGSIPHLSTSKLGEGDHFIEKGQEMILTKKKRDKHDKILVFEKYDGSNVGIAKKDGNILSLTRAGYTAQTSPYKQHHEFANWVEDHRNLFNAILDEGERIVGEWLIQAHGIVYDISCAPIIFFDFFDSKNERKLFESLRSTGLPLPRILSIGDAKSVEELLPILNLKTYNIRSKEDPEGMVYRVERNGKVDFLAKWIRKDFISGKYCIGVDEKDRIENNLI